MTANPNLPGFQVFCAAERYILSHGKLDLEHLDECQRARSAIEATDDLVDLP